VASKIEALHQRKSGMFRAMVKCEPHSAWRKRPWLIYHL